MYKIPTKLLKDIFTRKKHGVFLIGIDGCGGAGKSTVANSLLHQLHNAQLVHIDDFYKTKDQRVEVTGETSVHVNFEFERLVNEVITPLRHSTTAVFKTVNKKRVQIEPCDYVIIEGLGTLGSTLSDYFDYKIWISTSEKNRRKRGIYRDSTAWTEIWDKEYLPQDARYVREESPDTKADWVLHND